MKYMASQTKQKRPSKCRICGNKYIKRNTMQKACSPKCALELVKQAKRKEYDKETRKRKQALKTLSDYLSDAQTSVNRYIRVRDKSLPCISCGRTSYGKGRHAGHYRSRGAASQLRFNVFNINAQCYQCNTVNSGAQTDYRIGLIKKYGEAKVLELEHNNDIRTYSIEYAQRINRIFKKRARHLENVRALMAGKDV